MMTKMDEFIEKIEQLDPHLKVTKYNDLYNYEKVDMIIWYIADDDFKLPFAIFTYACDTPVVKTAGIRFGEADLVLYSKVIKLCADYFFPYLFAKKS